MVAAAAAKTNPSGCVENYVSGSKVDLFPSKVTSEEASGFEIQYFSTYKVLNNTAAGQTYVLYQCGTEKPAVDYPGALFVSIPVSKVGISSTTMLTAIEILGKRGSIKGIGSTPDYIASPCMLKNVAEKKTVVLDYDNSTQIDALNLDVMFTDGWWTYPKQVAVSEYMEKTLLGTTEWIEFFSVFFNAEDKVLDFLAGAKERIACHSKAVEEAVKASEAKPKVIWASFSPYSNAWTVGKVSGTYYAEALALAGAYQLPFPKGTADAYGSLTNAQFEGVAKDADIWIYTDGNFETLLAE
jgi:ABC-type Fe3+-hydroxamate transport system substrate-binding protein